MSTPRKMLLLFVVALAGALVVAGYPRWVEKPVLDGEGPLAIKIDPNLAAPDYHRPLDWWRTYHMDAQAAGDFTQDQCLRCHDPITSCNNCHSYVGVPHIRERKDLP